MGISVGAAERVGRRLAMASMLAGTILALAKIFVGIAAHSTAVVSDGFEAAADVISSGIVFAGLWLASRPPDDNHPYGHGRYETLAGLGVGAMLLATGAVVFWRSLATLGRPADVRFFAVYPLLAAVVVKCILAILKLRTSRRILSASLKADAWHDLTDLASTSVALIAVTLSLANPARFHSADHAGGMIIGLIVVFLGCRVIYYTVEQLVDTMPGERMMKQIREVAASVPGALNVEKCFARRTGLRYHVDLHLEVDPEMTVRESHKIAKQVKVSIKEELDWVADVLIHVEPARSRPANTRPESVKTYR